MKLKGVITMGLAVSMMMSLSSVAFANESSVFATQDKITVTKSAEWTKYNSQVADEKGNPYAKINFKVDTTQADTETISYVSEGGATDVMLLLDLSDTMMSNKKVDRAKEATKKFADSVMSISQNQVRIGLITFATDVKTVSDFTTDKTNVTNSIDSLKAGGLTNISGAIEQGTKAFEKSQAPNKIMVLLGDGMPCPSNPDVCKQKASAAQNAGIKIVTVGYDCTVTLLKDIASIGAGNKKLYYEASIEPTALLKDLGDTFVEIKKQVTSSVIGNSLIDTIPPEFEIIDSTITSSDNNVKPTISSDRRSLTWGWGTNKLEKKVYEMSVICTLDLSKVPADYITNNSSIFTNGTTIKTTADSLGSSVFGYGGKDVIKLRSPKLSLGTRLTESKTEDKKDPNDTSTNPSNQVDKTPKTGDSFNPSLFIILISASIVLTSSSVIMIKKRKH